MSNWSYVALAYGLTWVVLVGYAVYAAGRLRRARDTAIGLYGAREVEP